MKKVKSTLSNMIFVLAAISMISAAAVSSAYLTTAPTIEENTKKAEMAAIVDLFGNDFDNDPLAEKTAIKDRDGNDLVVYPLRKEDGILGLAINTYSSQGFGGDIYLMVGFYIDGTMAGYKVLNHKETPGLGSKIESEGFMSQFKWLRIFENTLDLRSRGGEIDGITSATISSKAVIDAVKRAKNAYDKFTLGAGNNE